MLFFVFYIQNFYFLASQLHKHKAVALSRNAHYSSFVFCHWWCYTEDFWCFIMMRLPCIFSLSLSLSLAHSLALALALSLSPFLSYLFISHVALPLYLSPSRLFMVAMKLWEQMHRYVGAANASVLSRWQKYSCRLFYTTVCHLGGGVGHGCRQTHPVPHNAPPVWYQEPCYKRNQFTWRGENSHNGKPQPSLTNCSPQPSQTNLKPQPTLTILKDVFSTEFGSQV